MSGRNRELPQWMSKKEKEKEKVTEPLKSKRKPKAARSVFYCMNEKELVEAAVSYLTSCARGALQNEHKSWSRPAEEKRTLDPVMEASCGELSDRAEAQDHSYVSESDVDLTEVETLPYAANKETGDDNERKAEERWDVNKDAVAQTPVKAQEDDALQLVRQIFFT